MYKLNIKNYELIYFRVKHKLWTTPEKKAVLTDILVSRSAKGVFQGKMSANPAL